MEKLKGKVSKMYNEFPFGDFSFKKKRYKLKPLLVNFLSRIKKGDMLFDVGCGSGVWIDLYKSKRIKKDRIVFIDLAQEPINKLKKAGFKAYCDDVLNLHLKEGVADFTICNGVIHHTPSPFRAFKELVRITKPGGFIYLSVYNKWSPYFYIVHKATYPFRYCYWNWNRNIGCWVYPLWWIIFKPLSYILIGEFLNETASKSLFMDQVMTPYAKLFSKTILKSYANRCKCEIEKFEYNYWYTSLSAIIQVNTN